MHESDIIAAVDAAVADGRIVPIQRDALLHLGRNDPDALRKFLAATPPVMLTEIELDVARAMGQDPVKFLEAKRKAIREGRAP